MEIKKEMKKKNNKEKRKIKTIIIVLVVLLVIAAIGFTGYNIYRFPDSFRRLSDNSLSEAQVNRLKEELNTKADKKVLVAYFSYSGTTQNIAVELSNKTSGDLFEITPQKTYSNVYTESNSEIRKGERPELTAAVENMDEYDIVFVGFPVWWHATPAVVNTFLESYDLTGKLIIPFCTSGESDIDEAMPTFIDSCDGLAVYGERRIGGANELDGWLSELGISWNNQESDNRNNQDNSDSVEDITGADNSAPVETADEDNNILIVYFSWSESGNTEKMAAYIKEQTKGELLEIQPLNPYPDDYNECGDVALAERDNNERPEIANLPPSIEEYDTIFIGYPIWWHTAPMIIGTFLESYDLADVEVYPFAQSASMDREQFENSMEFVRENADGAIVHDGLFVKAADVDGIDEYLISNGFGD